MPVCWLRPGYRLGPRARDIQQTTCRVTGVLLLPAQPVSVRNTDHDRVSEAQPMPIDQSRYRRRQLGCEQRPRGSIAPTHGSRMGRTEAQVETLSDVTLDGAGHRNHEELDYMSHRCVLLGNTNAHCQRIRGTLQRCPAWLCDPLVSDAMQLCTRRRRILHHREALSSRCPSTQHGHRRWIRLQGRVKRRLSFRLS